MELKSKSELMAAVIRGEALEAFEHSEEGMFNVTAMRALADRNPDWMYEVPVDQVAPFLLQNRVFDKARVEEITEMQVRQDPALCVCYPNPDVPGGIEHLFIDGTHRIVKALQLGIKEIYVYMIPSSEIIRPSPGWGMRPDHDWGDEIVNGKIVKRT